VSQQTSKLRTKLLAVALAGGAVAFSGSAFAATHTNTFSVTMTVTDECKVQTTNTLAFGTDGVIDANVDASANLGVQCTSGTTYDVGLSAGDGTGATTSVRRMTGPASAVINYAMYSDAGRTTNWGDTVATDTVGGTGDGTSVTHTVYGRVAPQTTPAAGAYTDTITATVTY
jgi:spore coat protein U-like protein